MTVRETQEAIKYIRDTFQREFGKEMNLERISAPLFVEKSSGLNDNLNGVERPVQFDVAGIPGETVEVVHSLAKWKRMALKMRNLITFIPAMLTSGTGKKLSVRWTEQKRH